MRGRGVTTADRRASHAFGVPGERRFALNCSGNVELLVHYLDLLIDHLPRKPIDRGVYSVMLFTFDNGSCFNLCRNLNALLKEAEGDQAESRGAISHFDYCFSRDLTSSQLDPSH